MGLFKTFLEFHDNLKQAWITLKLLEPLHTLATRAARSAASLLKIGYFFMEKAASQHDLGTFVDHAKHCWNP